MDREFWKLAFALMERWKIFNKCTLPGLTYRSAETKQAVKKIRAAIERYILGLSDNED